MSLFAFIHGAGDVGWYWHLVEAELRARGHRTVAPDLPIEDDAAGLDQYADVVVDAVGDGRDVIVVAQSFGGYVAPIVAGRLDARLIVLVAGMIPSPHESAETMFATTGWHPEPVEDTSMRRWPAVPTRFILCRNDRFFPPQWLRPLVQARLGITPDELDSGHCPALSQPVELARRLVAYAA